MFRDSPYNQFFNMLGIPSMEAMLRMMDEDNKKKRKAEFGITRNEERFEGCERLNIPHKYDNIEIGNKNLYAVLDGITTVYSIDGKFLFEGSKIKDYKMGMFLVGKQVEEKSKGRDGKVYTHEKTAYALFEGETQKTDFDFEPKHWGEAFNENGFAVIGDFHTFSTDFVINREGDIIYKVNRSDYGSLMGVLFMDGNKTINLLTGQVICEKEYSSNSLMEIKECIFVSVNKNCVFQISKHTGDYIIHGEAPQPKEEKTVAQAIKKATKTEPKEKPQGRNDICKCGSGKKHKHCCLNSPPS